MEQVEYFLCRLIEDIYAPETGWKQFLWEYKNNPAELLKKYAEQFGDLNGITGGVKIDDHILNFQDRPCRDAEARKARETLLECLGEAGWAGVE